jgi:kynureninase
MLSRVKYSVISEYIQCGIVSPRQIKEIRSTYELSHPQTEELVSELIAHGVCILDNDRVEYIRAVQTSIFSQNRRRAILYLTGYLYIN